MTTNKNFCCVPYTLTPQLLSMPTSKSSKQASPQVPWFEKFSALIVLVNFGLVCFDLSYVPWRNFYLQEFPSLTKLYDPIKGIEPHRETQQYLNTVTKLEQQLDQEGINGTHVQTLLQDLGEQSATMIHDNPFQLANKTGTLEKIKNRMRQHMHDDSATQSFKTFWSPAFLSQAGWTKELGFFDKQIRPEIATNYFRRFGENGDFLDRFWQIDIFFTTFFGIEFLARSFYLSRRYVTLTWLDAMLWRWYDIFLLLPFWRLLRLIPLTVRLNQTKLVNLTGVQVQLNRGVVASLGSEMTSVVVVQVLNLLQDSIERGDVARWFSQPKQIVAVDNQTQTLNNKVDTLVHHLLQVAVYKVIPKIQPDIETLINHSIESVLNQSPIYQSLLQVPAIGQLPKQLAEQLAHNLSESLYGMLSSSLEDTEGAKIVAQLTQHLQVTLISELQQQQTLEDIQSLLSNVLEDVKLGYLKQSTKTDSNQMLAEVYQLQQVTTHSNK